jgi:hypothetical protein
MRSLPLALAALLLAACPDFRPAGASRLEYADPPASSGWRLVRDPASTPGRLVLGLAGPAGTFTRGVGLNVRAAPGLRFGTFESGAPVEDAGVYELRSAADGAAEPLAVAGGVKDGDLLSAGVFQKDRARPAKDSGATLLRIAIELDPAATPRGDTRLALEVERAGAIPADIGAAGDPAYLLARKLVLTDLEVAVGKLVAR